MTENKPLERARQKMLASAARHSKTTKINKIEKNKEPAYVAKHTLKGQ